MQAVEIEVDTERNSNLFFRPLQRPIRGRFVWNRLHEPMARAKSYEWPLPIPGQRLGIDKDGKGYLIEPLHSESHAPIREAIEKRLQQKFEPAVQEFPDAHPPTWYFWIERAIKSGVAKVVSGKLPDAIEGEPEKDFVFAKREPSTADKLTTALTEQSQAFNRLAESLEDQTAAILQVLKSK